VADRVEDLREIERYDDGIWVGLEQTSDGMEKGDDGSRRGTSRTEANWSEKVRLGGGARKAG